MDFEAVPPAIPDYGELDPSLLIQILEAAALIVMITDKKGRVEYVNQGFEKETGYHREEIIGKKPSVLKSGLQDKPFYQRLWKTIQLGKAYTDVLINRRKDGSIYYEEKTITPLQLDQSAEELKYISIGRDITNQILENNRLSRLVHFDPVTDLPNRLLFTERLNESISYADDNDFSVALVYLNLHRFRRINETLGYESGDKILRIISSRLMNNLGDQAIIGRLSGDNIALIFEGKALKILEFHLGRIFALFHEPVECCDHEVVIDISVGVSFYPEDGDAKVLIEHAETAMMASKSDGVNNYHFYTSDLSKQLDKKLSLESQLRQALEKEQFVLHYQPQIDLKTHSVVGCEALIRWQHPERGLVGPAEFIDLLEETGLIIPVGNWVVEQACRDFQALKNAALECNRIAVNLSALQFNDAKLPFYIHTQLDRFQLPASSLELEITEGIMMAGMKKVAHTLNSLSDMGMRLSIDDFGTGFSSMNYLKNMPVNALKLALPFVQGLPDDSGDIGIARAVISLAHNLELQVVAEGVETEQQLDFLKKEGCDMIQGFLFSRPLAMDNLKTLLESGKML